MAQYSSRLAGAASRGRHTWEARIVLWYQSRHSTPRRTLNVEGERFCAQVIIDTQRPRRAPPACRLLRVSKPWVRCAVQPPQYNLSTRTPRGGRPSGCGVCELLFASQCSAAAATRAAGVCVRVCAPQRPCRVTLSLRAPPCRVAAAPRTERRSAHALVWRAGWRRNAAAAGSRYRPGGENKTSD
jgi:hypothetical protein